MPVGSPSAVIRVMLVSFGLLAAACGGSVEGDQWGDVTVTNNQTAPVTLATHPSRRLAPGEATVLHVDANNNPQALRVGGATGQVLGCLTFDFHTNKPATRSERISDAAGCPVSTFLDTGGLI
jgi:hypothetical protein